MPVLIVVSVLSLIGPDGVTEAIQDRQGSEAFTRVEGVGALSRASIYTILQDRRGFLWFGTGAGLYRYDGYELIDYGDDSSRAASPGGSIVWSLVEDARERLWVLTTAGVQILDRGSEKFSPPLPGSERLRGNSPNVGRLVRGPTETIWWVHKDHPPLRYDRRAGRFHRATGVDTVRAFYEDSGGVYWFSTEDPGLYRYDPDAEERRYFEPAPEHEWLTRHAVDAIRRGRNGTHWVVSRGGVGSFDPRTGEFTLRARFEPRPSRRPSRLVDDGRGSLWIRSLGELYRFDPERDALTQVMSSPDRDLWSVYPDRAGTVWIGTLGGLYRRPPGARSISHLGSDDRTGGLSSDLVTAIYEDPDRPGTVWVGTIGGGLNRIDQSEGRVTHFLDAARSTECGAENVWSIHEGTDEVLWFGTDCGLHRLDRRDGDVRTFLPRPARTDDHLQNNIDVITEDAVGRLWIGTYWGDLFRFDRTTEEFVQIHKLESPVRTLHADDGQLWIGTQGGGLLRMELDGNRLRRYPIDRHAPRGLGLGASELWFIHETDREELWLGTGAGLIRFRPEEGTFEFPLEDEEVSGSTVFGILEDEGGRFWLGTDHGLFRFDPDGPAEQRILRYDESDGVKNVEFNRRAVFQNHRGRFFFGGTSGLTSFHPERIWRNPHVPPVVLTEIVKSNRDTTVSVNPFDRDELVLSYRDYTVSFEFAALDYTKPARNRYAYRLEGFDGEWTPAGTRRYARYTNIPAGEYVFRVRGSNNHGVWNEEGTTVAVVVEAPFWQTWWFRLSIVLALAGLLAGAYRYRIRRLNEMHRLRLRIARDLHDDIGASLGSIALTSDMVRRRTSSEEERRNYLEKIGRTARETSADLREIVWLVNPNNERVDHLVEYMRRITGTLLTGIFYTFTVSSDLEVDGLGLAFRRNVLLIYKEILHNVRRHARATEVDVQLQIDGGRFVLRVTDDGVGFDPKDADGGRGLSNIRNRADGIGGAVRISSRPGGGTTVTFSAKIT